MLFSSIELDNIILLDKIDQSKYETGIKDVEVNEYLRNSINVTKLFIDEQMKLEKGKKNFRSDYYESVFLIRHY